MSIGGLGRRHGAPSIGQRSPASPSTTTSSKVYEVRSEGMRGVRAIVDDADSTHRVSAGPNAPQFFSVPLVTLRGFLSEMALDARIEFLRLEDPLLFKRSAPSASRGGRFLGIPSGGEAELAIPIPLTISRPRELTGNPPALPEVPPPPPPKKSLSSPPPPPLPSAMTGVLARSNGCKCVRERPRGPTALARAGVPPSKKVVEGGVDSTLRKLLW